MTWQLVSSSSSSSTSSQSPPSSSCGACKFLRRKCSSQCVFAPYFSYDEAISHFSAVHKVFGASNVSKLLLHLPVQSRNDAAVTIAYEALERMQDPTYGCVGYIFALQQQVANLQEEIEILGSQIATSLAGSEASFGSLPLMEDYFAVSDEHHHLHLHDHLVINTDDDQSSYNYQNQLMTSTNYTVADTEQFPFQTTLDSDLQQQLNLNGHQNQLIDFYYSSLQIDEYSMSIPLFTMAD